VIALLQINICSSDFQDQCNMQIFKKYIWKMYMYYISVCYYSVSEFLQDSFVISFQIFIAVIVHIVVFWAVTPCFCRKIQLFRRNMMSPSSGLCVRVRACKIQACRRKWGRGAWFGAAEMVSRAVFLLFPSCNEKRYCGPKKGHYPVHCYCCPGLHFLTLHISPQKMGAACSYKSAWCHDPEDHNLKL
jgi:hypothetical protein